MQEPTRTTLAYARRSKRQRFWWAAGALAVLAIAVALWWGPTWRRQAAMLIVRMRAGGDAAVGPLAHTLKGSASGIGAVRVEDAAAAAERSAGAGAGPCSQAVDRLATAVEEARALIAELLREP